MKEIIWFLFLTNGRLNRRGFWLYFGPFIAISVITTATREGPVILGIALFSVFLWTMFAVIIKRYHELNKSGWWSLLIFLPIGNIWVLIECGFILGHNGQNRFGNYKFLVYSDT